MRVTARIKGYTPKETRRIEAFVAAARTDTRTWQDRVLANAPKHLRAEIAAALPTPAEVAAVVE